MEIRRIELPRIAAGEAGGNVERAAESDPEVREVAAYAGPQDHGVIGRGLGIARSAHVVDVVVNPVADGGHARVAGLDFAKLATGEAAEQVRLAEAARIQIRHDVQRQIAHRQFLNALRRLVDHVYLDDRVVADMKRPGLGIHADEPASALIVREAFDGEGGIEGETFDDDALAMQRGRLDVQNENGGRLHVVLEA